jgi:hypothetical protein
MNATHHKTVKESQNHNRIIKHRLYMFQYLGEINRHLHVIDVYGKAYEIDRLFNEQPLFNLNI